MQKLYVKLNATIFLFQKFCCVRIKNKQTNELLHEKGFYTSLNFNRSNENIFKCDIPTEVQSFPFSVFINHKIIYFVSVSLL